MQVRQDDDVSIWTPQGKVLQVDYACEAVKLGSACLTMKSKDAVILCAIKRNPSKLATYQEKIFKISDQCGVVISGLTADARIICKYLRNENMNHKHFFGEEKPTSSLVEKISVIAQEKTYIRGKRPFGVGLLFAGIDKNSKGEFEPSIYQLDPSGEVLEFECYSIGARSQSIKTYLEAYHKKFKACNIDQLVLNGIKALNSTIREGEEEEEKLTEENIEVAIITKENGFKTLTTEELSNYLSQINNFKPEEIMELED